MGFRFFRRAKIAPGITINVSKSGPSVSIGPKGLKHTVGPRGSRTTVGIPGTGASYTHEKRHSTSPKKGRVGQDGGYASVLETLVPIEEKVFAMRSKVLKAAEVDDMARVRAILEDTLVHARQGFAFLGGTQPPTQFKKGHDLMWKGYNLYIDGIKTMMDAVHREDEALFPKGLMIYMDGYKSCLLAADEIEKGTRR